MLNVSVKTIALTLFDAKNNYNILGTAKENIAEHGQENLFDNIYLHHKDKRRAAIIINP
jgi:hypothetical protein